MVALEVKFGFPYSWSFLPIFNQDQLPQHLQKFRKLIRPDIRPENVQKCVYIPNSVF